MKKRPAKIGSKFAATFMVSLMAFMVWHSHAQYRGGFGGRGRRSYDFENFERDSRLRGRGRERGRAGGRGSLWQISVATLPDAEEAITALLEITFGQPACTYTDAESRRSTVSVYLSKRPDDLDRRRAALREGLERVRACGLKTGRGQISMNRTARRNWAHSWKRHFRPLQIGSRLLVKPSWSRRRPRKGQAVVVLDPGLSFGTGQHPTTAFCLRQVVGRRRAGADQSFLDLGTGSGILAIAAARLGYRPVEAWDFDADALRTALANARRNRVATRIRLTRRDVARLPRRSVRRYSVVCANLETTLLAAHPDRISALVESSGVLVLAGILAGEFARVRRSYELAGMRLIRSRAENRWRSGTFAWRQGG